MSLLAAALGAPAERALGSFGGTVLNAAGGAAFGGVVGSYYRGGGMGGAVKGAIAGSIAGTAMGAGAPRLLRATMGNSSYSGAVHSLVSGMESREGRTALFGGGSLLAGFAFGGNKSLARGFNSGRGNRVGH